MRVIQQFLICVICLGPSLAAQPWRADPTRLNSLAQDATGQVWGIGAFMSADLYRWEGDRWDPVPVSGLPVNSRPFALATGPDGGVYCLWSAGESAHTVTWHKGTGSRTVAQFTGDLANRAEIFVDPSRNIWVTERGIHIYRITPDGKTDCVYTIEYDHRYDANLPKRAHLNFNPVYATADGQGRIWFWSGGLGGGGGVPSLEGILIFDGNKFDHYPSFPGVPAKRFSAVEPEDADHMLLAAPADHLYRIDTKTLTATVVPEPVSNAFRFVQKIFRAERATYVVSTDGAMPVPERGGEGRVGALWRGQDGEWKRLVNGIDMRSQTIVDPPRSFLVTPAGLWLGAYGTGPWFIPAGPQAPVHVDWRYGYSLDGSEEVMALPDGRLLLVATTSGSMACGSMAVMPAELLVGFQLPAGVRTLNPLRAFVADQHGHIWGFLSGDAKAISEWDGKTWRDHALPEDFDALRFWNYGVDSRDRIWLLYTHCKGSVVILNPQRDTVEIYPDFSAALQAQLPDRASFHVQGNLFTVATFTPDGQIGYRDGCAQAHFFNGQTWQTWKPQDIDASRRANFDGPAFFDRAGNFAVNIAGTTWEYAKAAGWRITAFEPGFGTDQERTAPNSPPPPPGCEIHNPESVAQDRLGTYWLTSNGQLYRAIPGLCVAQFSPDQRQPFSDSRTIKTALIDPQGNAFLETYFLSHPEVGEYVILDALTPLPQTKVHASVEASGIVKLRFEARVKGKAWFTWRADGGAWSLPAESPDTTVNWLANGKHRIEAAALDERLQIDPTPATAEVEIEVDAQKQVAALIEQLKDPDYGRRDQAVAALVLQPALALPLLQSAREKAGPDERWWIDAAIQQIKENLAKNGTP
jgi:streptogramin lyase